ncbi:hypothetical protein N0V90_010650 [Kalmusia sp. IMI 367209]|nr:hypothetical protein N0V90_010650 [Kalmusia sp. IMI 367209]
MLRPIAARIKNKLLAYFAGYISMEALKEVEKLASLSTMNSDIPNIVKTQAKRLNDQLGTATDDTDNVSLYSIEVVNDRNGWRQDLIHYTGLGSYYSRGRRARNRVVEGDVVTLRGNAMRGLERAAFRGGARAARSQHERNDSI